MSRLVFVLLFLPILALAQLSGRVVAVADGDTFTLLAENTESRIRLHGIDCPERGQDFSQVAKTFLSDLMFGKTVSVKQTDTDRYGRVIGIVMVDGVNVNEALLKEGLAWHYVYYDKNPEWAKMEAEARRQKKVKAPPKVVTIKNRD